MSKDITYLSSLVKHIFEDDYASAKTDLESAIQEKLKIRMTEEMSAQKPTNIKGE